MEYFLLQERQKDEIEMLQNTSKKIARYVRDELEDLHADNATMDDATMPDINRAIRRGIFTYKVHEYLAERIWNECDKIGYERLQETGYEKIEFHVNGRLKFKQPPDYWEDIDMEKGRQREKDIVKGLNKLDRSI